MHFIARTRKILTFMSLTGECRQQKHTLHETSTKTECDYLNGWIKKKRSHTQKSHPKVVNPRDIAGERTKKKKKKVKICLPSKSALTMALYCSQIALNLFLYLCAPPHLSVSRRLPQNNTSVDLVERRLFPTSDAMGCQPPPFSTLLSVERPMLCYSGSSLNRCYVNLWTSCDVCCACQSTAFSCPHTSQMIRRWIHSCHDRHRAWNY